MTQKSEKPFYTPACVQEVLFSSNLAIVGYNIRSFSPILMDTSIWICIIINKI